MHDAVVASFSFRVQMRRPEIRALINFPGFGGWLACTLRAAGRGVTPAADSLAKRAIYRGVARRGAAREPTTIIVCYCAAVNCSTNAATIVSHDETY